MCYNKLHRYPTSEKSGLYKFKMAFFDNGEPEEFFLLVQHFKMTIEASGTLIVNAKLQYLHRLLRGKTLRQFDTVCFQVGILTPTYLNRVILGLGA